MNIESLKSKLSESEFAELNTYVSTLQGQKEEARKESIEGRKSLKAEVAKLTAIKSTLYDKLGLDDDANLDEVVIPTKGAELEATKKYERQLKKMQDDLKASQDSYAGLEKTHRSTLLDAQLGKAISQHQFIDNDLVSEFVKSRVVFEDGNVLYKDGDKSLTLDEGVKLIATTKPNLLKAQGNSGSGFNPNGSAGKVKDFKSMTLTEKNALYKENPKAYEAAKASV